MLGTLFIVGTPIGNLKDITFRATKTLREVDLILAEDTRVTRKLLSHYDIDKPVLSYHQHSKESKKMHIFAEILKGKDIALVVDAGTPGISDPGNELIDYLLEKEARIKIAAIPGPAAVTAALSVCGFNVNKFIFLGFFPKKKRKKLFDWLKEAKMTFAFYESPKRVLKTLKILAEHFGASNKVFIARELTKFYETLFRGTIKEVTEKLKEKAIKGEIVVVVKG